MNVMASNQRSGTAPGYCRGLEAVVEKPSLVLADDNQAMLSHVSDFLAKDFNIVAAVTDGESALQTYQERSPDALILDISMGKIGGLEVARLLRKKGSNAPIVFLTVHEEADFVSAALASGGSAYVVKSHMTKDLIPAIQAALSGKLFISPCVSHHIS